MAAFTIVKTHREVEKTKKQVSTSLNALLTGFLNAKNVMFIGEKPYILGWGDTFRLLIEGLDDCPLAYRNLILNSAYVIDRECPLAAPVYLVALQRLLHSPYAEETADKLKRLTQDLQITKTRVSSNTAIRVWEKTVHDESLLEFYALAKDALYKAGSLGTVYVERAELFPYISVSDGISLAAEIPPVFISQVGRKLSLEDCGVIIIDGAVLNVSEVHHILSNAHECKKPIAIFASQIHDEVANTLAVNWKQNKLRVLPIVLGTQLEDLNQIKDLSEIVGCIPITKDTGQRASNIKFDEIKYTQGVEVVPEKQEVKVSFYPSRFPVVIAQRNRLQEQIKQEKIQDVIDIMKKRLSRLNCRSVNLGLACTSYEEGILRDRIGSMLLFVSSIAAQGIIKTEKIYDVLNIKKRHMSFLPSGLPAATTNLAIRRAIADYRTINKIEAIIALDDE